MVQEKSLILKLKNFLMRLNKDIKVKKIFYSEAEQKEVLMKTATWI